jgi:hypothetical protein
VSLVFSHDDVWVRVYESLQTGVKSKSVTTDWAFTQNVTLNSDNQVATTKQMGANQDKDEVLGTSLVLRLKGLEDGNVFDLANSKTIKYIIELYYDDEVAQQTLTYTLYDCTPRKADLTDGDLNAVGREWKVGRYTKA